MPNVQHSVLTDPNLHEPKGVSTALEGQVYRANGSGSGSWRFPSGNAFGELYISGGTVAQTLPAASATAKLNPTGGWSANGNANVTLSGPNGTMTVPTAGEYLLHFWMSFSTASATAGSVYNFHYAVNGVPSTRKIIVAKVSNGADKLHVGANGYVALSANDVLTMYVGGDGTTSGTDITPLEAGFSVMLISPT